jgi:hypothetical protein
MEQQIIRDQLKRILTASGGVKNDGGKFSMYKQLAKVDPLYKNHFEDDGSAAYSKNKLNVSRKILEELNQGASDAEKIKLKDIPEHLITKTMDRLKKADDLRIKKLKKDYKESLKIYKKTKDVKRALNRKTNIDLIKGQTENERRALLYPELSKAEKYYPIMSRFPELEYPRAERGIISQYVGEGKMKKKMGMGGKKKKLSAYNKFVSRYLKANPTHNITDAAAAYRRS